MNHLSANIRYLRKQKGLTQEALANKIGINRSLIGAYEEGRTEPKLQTLLNICHYFDITMNDLIVNDLKKNNQTESFKDLKGDKLRILPVIVDGKEENEYCTIVPVKAAAGYLDGYGDIDYIESLPRFKMPFPELPAERTYRLFQISGESMLPVHPGTYIICEYLQDWHDIHNDECYVLVTKDEGIVYKRLLNNLNTGELVLKSDNPEYEAYTIKVNQVVEVWKALGFTTFKLPEAEQLQTQIDVLTATVMQLKDDIDRLKRKVR